MNIEINTSEMFFTEEEKKLIKLFINDGYVILDADNRNSLDYIKNCLKRLVSSELGVNQSDNIDILNFFHNYLDSIKINDIRVRLINNLNTIENIREHYFNCFRNTLDCLLGNELVMQKKINLSIQIPNDSSSLLAAHADTWSGDSPFEIVGWMPIVDCFGSKAMYILPPNKYKDFTKEFKLNGSFWDSEKLYQNIKDEVKWIEIPYGKVLVFNQCLPHGNRVNAENQTRFSMNCRFKGIFTPYGDKKLGEFFEPITLRPITMQALTYSLPETM